MIELETLQTIYYRASDQPIALAKRSTNMQSNPQLLAADAYLASVTVERFCVLNCADYYVALCRPSQTGMRSTSQAYAKCGVGLFSLCSLRSVFY